MKRQQYRRGYLRGLGLGVVVTALIFCITSDNRNTLSDAEIRSRALELGMVDGSNLTLADVKGSQQEEVSDAVKESTEPSSEPSQPVESTEPSQESVESTEPSQESAESTESSQESAESTESSQEVTENNEGSQSTEQSSEAVVESSSQQEANTEEVGVKTITVTGGESSYSVCVRLEEAGLIEDAWAFDRYLINIGYSRYVNTGTYKIELGTSEEEIAKIITRKQ